ncbi:MAG: STAS domain-containing protein [Planctomycetota bacterium]
MTDRVSGVLVVTPVVSCVFAEVAREVFEAATDPADGNDPSEPVVFDLQNVESVDSTFLGLLIGLGNRLAEEGRSLAISGASPHVRQVLQVTGVDARARVRPDVLGAVMAVSPEMTSSADRAGGNGLAWLSGRRG